MVRFPLVAAGWLATHAVAFAQVPSGPMDVLWENMETGETGDTSLGEDVLPDDAIFLSLTTRGDLSHSGTWVRFVAQAWIGEDFFLDPEVPPQYRALWAELGVSPGTELTEPGMPDCVLGSAELEALVAEVWNPTAPDPEEVESSFLPVFEPASGSVATRTWDGDYPELAPEWHLFWDGLTTPQDSTVVNVRPWFKRRLVEQTAGSSHPISLEEAGLFLEALGPQLEEHGYGLRLQAVLLWDDDPLGNGNEGEDPDPPGLTGTVVFVGTSTPLEYGVMHVQSGWGGGRKTYPLVPGFQPCQALALLPVGGTFQFQMTGLFGPTFALVAVNGNESNPLWVQVHPGKTLTSAELTVPVRLVPGADCKILRFVSNGILGPQIPPGHRDGFKVL